MTVLKIRLRCVDAILLLLKIIFKQSLKVHCTQIIGQFGLMVIKRRIWMKYLAGCFILEYLYSFTYIDQSFEQ